MCQDFMKKTEKDLTVINKFVGSSETVSIKINKNGKIMKFKKHIDQSRLFLKLVMAKILVKK